MPSLPFAVYGLVPPGLVEIPAGAVQCSPLVPGATLLAAMPPASLAGLVMHAPANAVERRHVLALALTALAPGGTLIALAANTRGGTRLAAELAAFGCTVETSHKRHHQIVRTVKPTKPLALDDALAAGAPRLLPDIGLWSQPGLFSSDHIDPGSRLLIDHLPPLAGRGADLGCGIGVLARAVRERGNTEPLLLVDIDKRALDMALKNVPGEGLTTLWADVRASAKLPGGLDFVITNPPFHDGGAEDKSLGQAFIRAAARMLKPGGVLWLTANRHLPYEATLREHFQSAEQITQAGGYKVYAARNAPAKAAQSPPSRSKARR